MRKRRIKKKILKKIEDIKIYKMDEKWLVKKVEKDGEGIEGGKRIMKKKLNMWEENEKRNEGKRKKVIEIKKDRERWKRMKKKKRKRKNGIEDEGRKKKRKSLERWNIKDEIVKRKIEEIEEKKV